MEVKELRVGNLVQWKDGRQVPMTATRIINYDAGLESIEPIPIKEEVLDSMLGFNKDIDNSYVTGFVRYILEGGYFDIYVECEDGECLVYLDDVCLNHIGYVHQLQNLYYAVRGEELDFEEFAARLY